MFELALRNLFRRPLRTGLTVIGLAVAVAVLGCLSSFGDEYRQGLWSELNRMGMQLMLVPLGCPYDAAARVLKGNVLENSLPEAAVSTARKDRSVAVAAPLLMAAVPHPAEGRTDLWVGLDHTALQLKPWWRAGKGKAWFDGDHSVILGAEAAEIELREPGDEFYSPETKTRLRVSGILARSGTSDDSLYFVPLSTAQQMFHQRGRITAVAIRLKNPLQLREAADRLQKIRGCQVVTLTEMMGTFLNLVGAVQTLLMAIACVAVAASLMSVFNTLLANVMEQTGELCVMRAIGASRRQIFSLVVIGAVLLALAGTAAGLVLTAVAGRIFESLLAGLVPMAPSGSLLALTAPVAVKCLAVGIGAGVVGSLYPAWQASRLHPSAAVRAR